MQQAASLSLSSGVHHWFNRIINGNELEVRRQDDDYDDDDDDDDDNRLAELTDAMKSIYKPEEILWSLKYPQTLVLAPFRA